jgi:hypothetical protein
MKRCACCKLDQDENQFHKCKGRKDGLKPYCKSCVRKKATADSDKLRAYKKNWYQNNRESVIERVAERTKRNSEEIKEYKTAHYINNQDVYKQRASNYYYSHQDEIKEYLSTPEVKQRIRQWQKNRYKNKPHEYAWRGLLRRTLRFSGRKKTDKTVKMLGYTESDLKLHIESLWLPEMNWQNYGEWHIDHIRPISSFDKDTNPSIVNALSNLRPMWATSRTVNGVLYEGNINKGNKHG